MQHEDSEVPRARSSVRVIGRHHIAQLAMGCLIFTPDKPETHEIRRSFRCGRNCYDTAQMGSLETDN
ncbi:hypothetical protein FCL47_04710 [Desulfopila sp. IMCC35006]|uniref:hypothetical protein n=1 Tax=Desulfopila sp. IMCC35006 TaxID=2569542 RepID=UPI0010ACF8F3|nr:hypothetical protein [Desulfopila sp. IMCC35006]TKB27444.1 hypothetical protein FCL47_04710 [Desulfopila sp. IMCC35006]